MAIRVGLRSAVIAPLTKDLSSTESETGNPVVTYGAIRALPRAQQLDLTATVQSVNVDADDTTDVLAECSGYTGTLTRDSFTPEDLQIILGEKVLDGMNVSAGSDEPGYFALGFKSELKGVNANGQFLYMWILKTKFAQSNLTAQSRGSETMTPQADAITFSSVSRNADNAWRFYQWSKEPDFDKSFFSANTLQKLATALSQVYAQPAEVEVVESLPEKGAGGIIYMNSQDNTLHYWDGSKFVEIPKG